MSSQEFDEFRKITIAFCSRLSLARHWIEIGTFSLSRRGSPASLRASCSRGGTLADMITFSLLILYRVSVQLV